MTPLRMLVSALVTLSHRRLTAMRPSLTAVPGRLTTVTGRVPGGDY